MSAFVDLDDQKSSAYGLCAIFLPGNSHALVGTKEGHLLVVDVASGDLVDMKRNAHSAAIWALDSYKDLATGVSKIASGSADQCVHFWVIEESEEKTPKLLHDRTLQVTNDVIAVRFSYAPNQSKRFVFVSTTDCAVRVFFEDSLKLFLTLYGHKLPALAVDCSDDDTILASAGADKTVRIFGLDFGDAHRSLYGHDDTITDLQFVKRTHKFFSSSKDRTIRYWDADHFVQIQVFRGHFAEVSSLAINRTGAFVLSAGMDRQVRVWERTNDIVFLDEEAERELESEFDKMHGHDQNNTAELLESKSESKGSEIETVAQMERNLQSIASEDRIIQALELADKESANPENRELLSSYLPNKKPYEYVLFALKSIKPADLEQSLVMLPMQYLERLLFYIIQVLSKGEGVEICARVVSVAITARQNEVGCCSQSDTVISNNWDDR